jgi:hypothetical protein
VLVYRKRGFVSLVRCQAIFLVIQIRISFFQKSKWPQSFFISYNSSPWSSVYSPWFSGAICSHGEWQWIREPRAIFYLL